MPQDTFYNPVDPEDSDPDEPTPRPKVEFAYSSSGGDYLPEVTPTTPFASRFEMAVEHIERLVHEAHATAGFWEESARLRNEKLGRACEEIAALKLENDFLRGELEHERKGMRFEIKATADWKARAEEAEAQVDRLGELLVESLHG